MQPQSAITRQDVKREAELPTVLVVDDEPLIRMASSDYLRDHGFTVFEASSAAEAIERIEDEDIVIDLIFSDVQMAGAMNGIGLAQWVRQNRSEIPVILTSGKIRMGDDSRQLFLAKPYDHRDMTAQIRRTIAARAHRPH